MAKGQVNSYLESYEKRTAETGGTEASKKNCTTHRTSVDPKITEAFRASFTLIIPPFALFEPRKELEERDRVKGEERVGQEVNPCWLLETT
ncbi:UNVERIFIED_CONTAM: hypothetical protein K2H54_055540 [Gekko kuhli]